MIPTVIPIGPVKAVNPTFNAGNNPPNLPTALKAVPITPTNGPNIFSKPPNANDTGPIAVAIPANNPAAFLISGLKLLSHSQTLLIELLAVSKAPEIVS